MRLPIESFLLASRLTRKMEVTVYDGRFCVLVRECSVPVGIGYGASLEEAAANAVNVIMARQHAEEERRP